jgi:hypothetical protein
MADQHPGFRAVAEKIAREKGVSKERASAMLASGTRKAIKKGAAKKNPNLLKVKG